MIAGSDAALDADAELVPVSSGSTASESRALRKIRAMCGNESSGSADTGSSQQSLEKKSSGFKVSQDLNLKDNFSATRSAMSRNDSGSQEPNLG